VLQNSTISPQPITNQDGSLAVQKKRKKFPMIGLILGSIGLLLGIFSLILIAYNQALQPVDSHDSSPITVEVVSGMTPDQIAELLKEKQLIRSVAAFMVYTRFEGVQNKLQAGTYTLHKSDSAKMIARALAHGGASQEVEITFLPGGTLRDAKKELLKVGFSETEIDTAFSAKYDHPLLAGRPAGTDIEGFLYGETHRFDKGASLQDVLTKFFDDFYAEIKQDNLEAAYKKQGLTLYQGITLASIIQRESGGDDEAQIAQVFYLRLKQNIPLGSDVTYQYIADKLGLARDPNLNNPYNTRRVQGLPPTPIATPGKKALQAVASPARGDYLYFLSGDDDVTYFAHTEEGHQANIRSHCQEKCKIL
jgi:UPF0755 protein